MKETNNIEDSFRNFLAHLNEGEMSLKEAKIILTGNDLFYGLLNIVFDFHEEDLDSKPFKEKTKEKEEESTQNILKEIEMPKPIVIQIDPLKPLKETARMRMSLEGNTHSGRKNFVATELYRNHFLCSLLSDSLIDLFLPQCSRHYVKFLKGKCSYRDNLT